MKSWLSKGMLAGAILLPALSGMARADDFGCSNATLKGEYAFGTQSQTFRPERPEVHAWCMLVVVHVRVLVRREYFSCRSPFHNASARTELTEHRLAI